MFSYCLVPFEPFAPCSYILGLFLWGGFLLVLKFSSLFRAVCSLFSNSSPFRAVGSRVFKLPNAFGAVCSLFLGSVVSFGLRAVFFQSALCAPSGLLLFAQIFKSVFCNCLVSFEWLAPCSRILYSLWSGFHFVPTL